MQSSTLCSWITSFDATSTSHEDQLVEMDMTETYLNALKECRNLEACVKQNEEENDLAYINTETVGQKRFEARLCQTGTRSDTSIFSRT